MGNHFQALELPTGVTRRHVLDNMETKGLIPALPNNLTLNNDGASWTYTDTVDGVQVALDSHIGDALFKAHSEAVLRGGALAELKIIPGINRQTCIDAHVVYGASPLPTGLVLETEVIDGKTVEYWTYTDGTNTVRMTLADGDTIFGAHIRIMKQLGRRLPQGVLP